MKLVEVWVKAPFLHDASLLVVGECVQQVFPDVFKDFTEKRVVLTSCPEAENSKLIMGKLASIIRCSKPREITVLTIDGSPDCFQLHSSANEALFITKENVPLKHFVIVEGKCSEVSAESVRVGRYLHLVQNCIQKNPEVLKDLKRYSLEHCSKAASET